MTHETPTLCLPFRRRIIAAAAALTTTMSIVGALMLTFDAASPTQWLAPSPLVMERVSRCNELPTRRAREDCSTKVVAAMLQRQQPTQVAAR